MSKEKAFPVVIIPACNEAESITDSLCSIVSSINVSGASGEIPIVVVDNNSIDGTDEVVLNFKRTYSSTHLVIEPNNGVGHARHAGVEYALSNLVGRETVSPERYWFISTDADVEVPLDWIGSWLRSFEMDNQGLIAGRWRFPDETIDLFPNYRSIHQEIGRRIGMSEELFGVINIEGNNSAINGLCYSRVGPFSQPTISLDGRTINMPGEDWDLGTRAVWNGINPVRADVSTIVMSSRRFDSNPREYLDGTAYEKEFLRVDADMSCQDALASEMDEMTLLATTRMCMHFIEKPIIVDNSLLEVDKVVGFLGALMVKEMLRYLILNEKPDFITNRNEFVLKYLLEFHNTFSHDIAAIFNRE